MTTVRIMHTPAMQRLDYAGLTGTITPVPEAEQDGYRAIALDVHPSHQLHGATLWLPAELLEVAS